MKQHDGELSQDRTRHRPRERDLLDTSTEVEVAKAILLREEYVARVKSTIRRQGSKFGKDQGAFDDLISLLDLVRSATVDVVEAIQNWRKLQGHPKPFTWGGINYLLKIPVDLDFLDNHKVRYEHVRNYCLLCSTVRTPTTLRVPPSRVHTLTGVLSVMSPV